MKRKGRRNYPQNNSRRNNKQRRERNRKPRRKQSIFKKLNYFSKKNPVITGIILIFSSIVLFRLSFTNAFLNSSEIFMWSIILSIGIFLIGFFIIIGWWRNNISMLTTKHNVNWKNR